MLPSPASDLFEIDLKELSGVWDREHISRVQPGGVKHAELKAQLEDLRRRYADLLRTEPAGRSVEGREIYLITLGAGPDKILLWSQMHGDEPTATSSLLDLLEFFGRHRREPWVAEVLKKYTLLCIPMLNPDGAERGQRRNAQGIDINRDARLLQTPEGRLLKDIRDRHQPFLGFNLHNQGVQTTVGDTGRVATIALLAVAADMPGARNVLSKQVAAALHEALSQFVYGHISRYAEDYNPRAFGDNLTAWSTPVVLIESGGAPAGQPPDLTVKLNFVGLLAVFNSLATGRIQNADPALFDAMNRNSSVPIFDIILRNASIFTGTGVPLFRGDIAIGRDARTGNHGKAIIADLGDLGVFTAHETIDCTGSLITPGLIGWAPSQSFLDDSSAEKTYLERGFLTVLETASWNEIQAREPAPDQWKQRRRPVHWGFIIAGDPPRKAPGQDLRLVEWLAAGGKGWVVDSVERVARRIPQASKIPQWFGLSLLSRAQAERFRIPEKLEGDPVSVLPRWTSEAARQFRLGRRGTLAIGAPADLVIWSRSHSETSNDLRAYRPGHIVLNGIRLDASRPGSGGHGRFLGRNPF